jgi:hypothetical protein
MSGGSPASLLQRRLPHQTAIAMIATPAAAESLTDAARTTLKRVDAVIDVSSRVAHLEKTCGRKYCIPQRMESELEMSMLRP